MISVKVCLLGLVFPTRSTVSLKENTEPAENVFALIESGQAIEFAALAADISCDIGVSAVKGTVTPEDDLTLH
jgi:hypothetical protein